jgi:hypothetical protein
VRVENVAVRVENVGREEQIETKTNEENTTINRQTKKSWSIS